MSKLETQAEEKLIAASYRGLDLLVAAVDAQQLTTTNQQQSQLQSQQIYQIQHDSSNSSEDEGGTARDASQPSSTSRQNNDSGEVRDASYWEKRRKNNEAARRSREKRRLNDLAMETRLLELSQQNDALKAQLETYQHNGTMLNGNVPTSRLKLATQQTSPINHVVPKSELNSVNSDDVRKIDVLPELRSAAVSAASGILPTGPMLPALQGVNTLSGTRSIASAGSAFTNCISQSNNIAPAASNLAASVPNLCASLAGVQQSMLNSMLQLQQQQVSGGLPPSPAPLPSAGNGFPWLSGAGVLPPQLFASLLAATPAGFIPMQVPLPSAGHPFLAGTMASTPISAFGTSKLGDNPSVIAATMAPSGLGLVPPPVKRDSPDTTTSSLTAEDMLKSVTPSSKNGGIKFADGRAAEGKQYLRSKLLAKQNRLKNSNNNNNNNVTAPVTATVTNNPLLSSLIANRVPSQPVLQEGATLFCGPLEGNHFSANGLEKIKSEADSSLKNCLSSLSVNLNGRLPAGLRGPSLMMPLSLVSPSSAADYANSTLLNVGSPSIPFSPASLVGGEDHSGSDQSVGSMEEGDGDDMNFGSDDCPRKYRRKGAGEPRGQVKYLERRRRNNEAAKRCRANRRALFEYRFRRSQELEQENATLKKEMSRLTMELRMLRDALSQKPHSNGKLLEHLSSNVKEQLAGVNLDGGVLGSVAISTFGAKEGEHILLDIEGGQSESSPRGSDATSSLSPHPESGDDNEKKAN